MCKARKTKKTAPKTAKNLVLNGKKAEEHMERVKREYEACLMNLRGRRKPGLGNRVIAIW